jgi:hypothetical protein
MLVYVFVESNGAVAGYSHSEEPNTIPYEANEDFLNCPFKYSYSDGHMVVNVATKRIIESRTTNKENQSFLDSTDWMCTRHRDQIELGIETTLTNEEFLELLKKRNEARASIINK